LLCYRCGSHVPDSSEKCESCGQQLVAGSARRASSAFQRRRVAPVIEGAPYRTGDLIAGRYEVKEIVGAGPVGFLFRARDKDLDVEVAVKVVNARLVQTLEDRDGFSRVIRLGRKLSHQNLSRINEDGEERGFPFYTTPYLDGFSLRKIIELRQSKGQAFSLQEVEPILGQIASGLTSAHKIGPHANLKPENIIVLPDLLKVTDFGLGSALPRTPFLAAQRTRKADTYFAPEFLKGAKPDPRMDVYAMGVILGEMLTGLLPEPGVTPELTRKRPELSGLVDALYRRALHENPQVRFQTPAEFFQELATLLPSGLRSIKVPDAAPPVPEEAKPPGRRTGEKASANKPSRPLPGLPPPSDETQPFDASMLPFALAEAEALAAANGEPPDATQPVKASMLAGMMAQVAKAPKPTLEAGKGDGGRAPPMPSLRAQQGPFPETTQPLDRLRLPSLAATGDGSPTMALDVSALPRQAVVSKPRKLNGVMWLVLLTSAAALLGAVGGYLLLQFSQKSPQLVADGTNKDPLQAGELHCPKGMVWVPAGPFSMGTPKQDGLGAFNERLLGPVDVGAFCIDVYEYPNEEGRLPRSNISWAESKALCESRGRRLCTEEEWEKACKGPEGVNFPYGDAFDADVCNTEDASHEDRQLASAGQFFRCKSGYGAMDLSGNLAEWTATPNATDAGMTQKGGSYVQPDHSVRCSARLSGASSDRTAEVGFRCCLDGH